MRRCSTHRLTLHVPIFPIIVGLARCEIDITDLQYHLNANVPKFPFQIDKDRALVLAFMITIIGVSSLLRGFE